jgi:hypothetical protein
MPYKIILDNLPLGIALTSIRDGGEVEISFREFTSSEDGDIFIHRLEGIPSDLLPKISVDLKPSAIDHMLVLINKDKSAIVYINELKPILKIRPKRTAIKVGEPIFQDDIAEIESLTFGDEIKLKGDIGIIFIFSVGWRKGLFYDFGAFHQPPMPISYDLEKLFGHYFAYLSFQHLFKLTDDEWSNLFSQMWFPFVTLKTSTVQRMLSYVKSNIPVDDLIEKIAEEVQIAKMAMLERWRGSPILANHMKLIERAVERYEEKDYISATTILYTRIEGIMRDVFQEVSPSKKPSAKKLTETITLRKESSDMGRNILLPRMFHKYLNEVYFRNFDSPKLAEMSRNSVAHGIAKPQDFSIKAATIGLLLLDQLFHFLSSEKS